MLFPPTQCPRPRLVSPRLVDGQPGCSIFHRRIHRISCAPVFTSVKGRRKCRKARMMRYTQSRAALSAHLFSMLGALLIAANFGPAANAQSFDCRNARFADEKAICQDTRLGGLDKQLADTYDRAGTKLSKEERQEFEKNETAFVNARHRCGGHQGCIEQSYRNRLQELL